MYLVAPAAVAVGMSWQYSGAVRTKCAQELSTQVAVDFKDSETDEDGNFHNVSDRICWLERTMGNWKRITAAAAGS